MADLQTKNAKQKSKGGARNQEEISLPKGAAPRSYETALGNGKGSSKRGVGGE